MVEWFKDFYLKNFCVTTPDSPKMHEQRKYLASLNRGKLEKYEEGNADNDTKIMSYRRKFRSALYLADNIHKPNL